MVAKFIESLKLNEKVLYPLSLQANALNYSVSLFFCVCVNFQYLGLVFGNFEIVERVGCHEQL